MRQDGRSANQVKESTSNLEPQELAGNASLRPPSSSSTSSSADVHWNADTGATSHMTPHCHWFQDYKPYHIPIQLAMNEMNEIVHSTGRGWIIFAPIIDGKVAQNIIFSKVLHVPALQNNLLAILHLTTHHKFTVSIVRDCISFLQGGNLCFYATV